MQTMNPEVDLYLAEGCGRCSLHQTPECKIHTWQDEMKRLREIILESELTEERKWGVACYTYEGTNVLLLSAFKEYCAVSFFKGALLNDPQGVLEKPGENTQAARVIRFTGVEQVREIAPVLKACIEEAIEVEKAGLEYEYEENPEPVPDELLDKFHEMPELEEAFYALTPGRQRGYILHFSGAKQSKTRVSRIEKYIPKILDGKGFHDR